MPAKVNPAIIDLFRHNLNTDYEPGHFAYGVPQPGVMLVNPEGGILAKFAEENYRIRPDWSDVVAAAKSL